jgi:uncharacterized membrane protein
MTQSEHVWAIGYDDMERIEQVRDEIIRLGWHTHCLDLRDVAVVVRHPDGSFTGNRERFPTVANLLGGTVVGFLAGLVLLAPLTGAAVGALLGDAGTTASVATVGTGDDFVREVEGLIQPGTSALFVLGSEGDMEVILYAIQGLGGTV